jgi:hypothetical protein
MNKSLMRALLIVTMLVNIVLASSIFYQQRIVIPSNDPKFPAIMAKLEARANETEAKLKNFETQFTAFLNRPDKFESALSSLGNKMDDGVDAVNTKVKKVMGSN